MKKYYESPEVEAMAFAAMDTLSASSPWSDMGTGDVGQDWYWEGNELL